MSADGQKGGSRRSIGPDNCPAIPINMGIIEAIHRIALDFGLTLDRSMASLLSFPE